MLRDPALPVGAVRRGGAAQGPGLPRHGRLQGGHARGAERRRAHLRGEHRQGGGRQAAARADPTHARDRVQVRADPARHPRDPAPQDGARRGLRGAEPRQPALGPGGRRRPPAGQAGEDHGRARRAGARLRRAHAQGHAALRDRAGGGARRARRGREQRAGQPRPADGRRKHGARLARPPAPGGAQPGVGHRHGLQRTRPPPGRALRPGARGRPDPRHHGAAQPRAGADRGDPAGHAARAAAHLPRGGGLLERGAAGAARAAAGGPLAGQHAGGRQGAGARPARAVRRPRPRDRGVARAPCPP